MAKSETSLLDAARAESGNTGPRSDVDKAAERMPPNLRAEFAAALADDTISARGLSRALKARDYLVSEASIMHWRRQGRTLS